MFLGMRFQKAKRADVRVGVAAGGGGVAGRGGAHRTTTSSETSGREN